MYVCGPTVYDDPHIGNARPLVVFDILFKLLKCKYGDNSVTYVRNITDIDDKIIKSSKEKKISTTELTLNITKKGLPLIQMNLLRQIIFLEKKYLYPLIQI